MDNNKNNYTQIPNELIEIIISKALNRSESRILGFMARKIYGYHKNSDQISYSQIQKGLSLGRTTVIDSLKRLQLVGIVKLVSQGKSSKVSNEWRLDYSDYITKLVGITKLVRYNPDKLVGITNHTKDITKESIANDAIAEILSIKGEDAWVKSERLFVHGKAINNPIAYLEAIKKNEQPTNSSFPLKPASQLTDNEIRKHLKGKVAGRDEGIDQDVLYEALERGLYSA